MKIIPNTQKVSKKMTHFNLFTPSIFKDKLKILSKYKCKVNNMNYKLTLTGDYLLIEGKDRTYKLPYKGIKEINLKECLWSIRVKVAYQKEMYQFDFPSFKIATQFYEQLIYSKVYAQLN